MIIRRLAPSNAKEFRAFRLLGLRESPTAFGSSFTEESKFPLKVFADRLKRSNTKWAFGAFENGRLVGFVTLIREERMKEQHKATVYGMYVAPKLRRRGIGRKLLARVIQVARKRRGLRQVRLAVVEGNVSALTLYESAGFKVYGREEAALFVSGRFYSELFLVLRLRRKD